VSCVRLVLSNLLDFDEFLLADRVEKASLSVAVRCFQGHLKLYSCIGVS
jgi:hypothetical protein